MQNKEVRKKAKKFAKELRALEEEYNLEIRSSNGHTRAGIEIKDYNESVFYYEKGEVFDEEIMTNHLF